MEIPVPMLSPKALRHEVVKHLLGEIFDGRLPAGSRLVVQKLSARFGISSTPVREALVELESVGVVEISHNRGAVVRPFGPEQLREIYQLRRILEAEAARAACGKMEQAELARLRKELLALAQDHVESAPWSAAAMDVDCRLHHLIATHCGSDRLAGEIARYNVLVQGGRELVGNQRQAQDKAVQDHIAILDALLANNADESARQMARHIDSTAAHVEAIMFAGRT
jgi:DNA-binding GntR family transcriptional regulator